MAPFIQEFTDLSLSSHHNLTDEPKSIIAPLHETTTTRPRRVSFGALVTSHEVLHRMDYTAEEMESSWFGREDMIRMKENARSDAKLVEKGILVHGADVSIRGLESRTRDGMRRKRRSRINAYAAVFFEIDCQQQECFVDEDLIADAYFTYSEPCAMTAQMNGKRDEIEARKLLCDQKSDFFGARFCNGIVALPKPEGLASSAA
mmetsp:Transcript_3337/g.7331  ORF Transcript_3337/g.7331 Transcript_3337/m.7331 type:complete len:204 (+) Transcript_3337:74-685(+)|eukprot:CAMPEP_0201116644 /NCGR_PEP_ID=MMETSP0850-20130426/847_1 /ASSEMBLY_ACC=CAM_ASM_000622 /TAXON_ID=183588 /ORGANISM="Pseudo-nitzschia fraudulenta, Strain WWA7" /LENGTH=203 /DNA_ID=CAMNT_0047380765 /DNA_START=81 /DNA_END=692 /DNA_ORIENTATION=+